jgi:hypothetical protein
MSKKDIINFALGDHRLVLRFDQPPALRMGAVLSETSRGRTYRIASLDPLAVSEIVFYPGMTSIEGFQQRQVVTEVGHSPRK